MPGEGYQNEANKWDQSMYEYIYSFLLLKDIYGNLNVPGAMLERSLFIRPRETKAQEGMQTQFSEQRYNTNVRRAANVALC